MRISDWSSDVCSSDLIRCAGSVLRSVSLEHVRVRVVLAGAALGEAELQGQAVARVGGAQRGFALDPAFLVEPEQALVERLHAFLQRLLHRLLRSEEHTSELQSLMRISYAVFCLKQKQYLYTHNQ